MLKVILANLLSRNTKFATQSKIKGCAGIYHDGAVLHD